MLILVYLTTPSSSSNAPLIYSSEPDCREPNVEQESEPESQPITDPFKLLIV